jgi:hypothetical protein
MHEPRHAARKPPRYAVLDVVWVIDECFSFGVAAYDEDSAM